MDRAEDSEGWWAGPRLCSGVTHRADWIEACDWTAASWNQEANRQNPTQIRTGSDNPPWGHEDRDKSLHQVRAGQVNLMCATWYAKLTATLAAGGLQVDVILTVITLIPPLRWSGLYLFAHKTQSRTHTHEIHLCNTCWRFSFSCFSHTSHIQHLSGSSRGE